MRRGELDDRLQRNERWHSRALPVWGLPRWGNPGLFDPVLWGRLVVAALRPVGADSSAEPGLWARGRLSGSPVARPAPRRRCTIGCCDREFSQWNKLRLSHDFYAGSLARIRMPRCTPQWVSNCPKRRSAQPRMILHDGVALASQRKSCGACSSQRSKGGPGDLPEEPQPPGGLYEPSCKPPHDRSGGAWSVPWERSFDQRHWTAEVGRHPSGLQDERRRRRDSLEIDEPHHPWRCSTLSLLSACCVDLSASLLHGTDCLHIAMSLLGRWSAHRWSGVVGLGQLVAEKSYGLGQGQNFLFSQSVELLM